MTNAPVTTIVVVRIITIHALVTLGAAMVSIAFCSGFALIICFARLSWECLDFTTWKEVTRFFVGLGVFAFVMGG